MHQHTLIQFFNMLICHLVLQGHNHVQLKVILDLVSSTTSRVLVFVLSYIHLLFLKYSLSFMVSSMLISLEFFVGIIYPGDIINIFIMEYVKHVQLFNDSFLVLCCIVLFRCLTVDAVSSISLLSTLEDYQLMCNT